MLNKLTIFYLFELPVMSILYVLSNAKRIQQRATWVPAQTAENDDHLKSQGLQRQILSGSQAQ